MRPYWVGAGIAPVVGCSPRIGRFTATERVAGAAVLNNQDISSDGNTSPAYESPDAARCFSAEAIGTVEVITVVLDGIDGAEEPRTETLSVTGGGGIVNGKVAMARLDTVTWSGGTSGTMDVGIRDVFGLPAPMMAEECVLFRLVAGAPDAGTLVVGSSSANADPNGTWEPTTWAGAKAFDIAIVPLPVI